MKKLMAIVVSALSAAVAFTSFAEDDWTGEPDRYVDYIESTGKQWIDLGIISKSDIRCETDMMWCGGGDVGYLGARNSMSTDSRLLPIHAYNNVWCGGYGKFFKGSVTITQMKKYHVVSEFKNGSQTIVVGEGADASTVFSQTETGDIDTDTTLTLFAVHYKNDSHACQSSARCYSLKIVQNGVSHTFRPCVKNGEGCLYNPDNGQYYRNGGDGALSFQPKWFIPAPGGVGDVAALKTALASHAKGDVIELAAGTYSLTETLSNNGNNAVTVRGATGDPKDVVIDGQGQVRCLNLRGKDTYGQSVYYPPNAADRVILKDVTIANGMQRDVTDVNCSPGGDATYVGAGGVYLRYGFVENCVFTNCQARAEKSGLNASGGALFARIAFVTNCTFIACEAYSSDRTVRGGALCGITGGSNETYTPADLRFLSCRCVNNSTANSATGNGGAAFFSLPAGTPDPVTVKLVFVDCVATNTAGWNNDYHPNGGGLYYASNPKVTFTDCVFSNCLAYGKGGGFWTSKSCIVSNCTFVGNCAANSQGGGLYASAAVTAENCLFKDNFSLNQGGGIYSSGGKLTARHSCFDQNQVPKGSGGAICASLGVDAEDCIFRDNVSANVGGNNVGGGGIYMAANESSPCLINRCLFQGNRARNPDDYYFNGGTAIYLNANKQGRGVFVRNCVFTGNSGASVFAVADRVTGETPTWENGAGFYVQNCTITNNVGTTYQWTSTGSKAIFDGAVAKASAWQGLFVENCAISGNTDFADGVFFPNFVNNDCLATQVRNCASDVTTAFPEYGTNGNIAWKKNLKNLGYNSSWITAESTDGGDGTWTEQPVGIYGYYVAANGVNPRCLNEHPAIGAQEPRNFGLMLILR